jgi:hypothetical protein
MAVTSGGWNGHAPFHPGPSNPEPASLGGFSRHTHAFVCGVRGLTEEGGRLRGPVPRRRHTARLSLGCGQCASDTYPSQVNQEVNDLFFCYEFVNSVLFLFKNLYSCVDHNRF